MALMLADGQGELFLATIAVPPGDPAALAAGARTYTAAHGEIERNRAALAAATEQVGGPAWQGMGASSYATFTTDLAATYGVTAAGLAQGATTLRTYSTALAKAQETARQANAAVGVANASASRFLDAQASAQQAQASADNAAEAATTAEDQATANPHSSSAQLAATNARSAANDAQSASDSAASQVNVMSGIYDADRARAMSLISEAQSQASHAASAASAGFDAAAGQVAGSKAHNPHGGAKGVLGGAKWLKLTDDVNEWVTGFEGAFAVPAGGIFLRAASRYFGAAADLDEATDDAKAATTAYQEAYDAFYGVPLTQRTQGWFDLMAKQRAMQAAQADEAADGIEAAKAEQALGESIADTGSLVGKFSMGMYGLAIASDIYTEFRPSTAFGSTGAVLDRVNAGLNMAASGLALADAADLAVAAPLMAIPGVDVAVGAVLIGTAVYSSAELLWEHEGGAIKRDLHDVGHWASDVGSFLGL
jgi:trimeric autotransporter adhesin